jgi:hypothetical protein
MWEVRQRRFTSIPESSRQMGPEENLGADHHARAVAVPVGVVAAVSVDLTHHGIQQQAGRYASMRSSEREACARVAGRRDKYNRGGHVRHSGGVD